MSVHLLFIASEWGISSGGVNSFNYDFCNSIVKISKKQSDITVYCLSLTAVSDIDKYNVKKEGIELISLSNSYDENVANGECIPVSFVECVNKLCNFDAGDKLVWIGHDIITGNLANSFKSKFSNYSSISVVFHHMNYDEYCDADKAIETFKGRMGIRLDSARIRIEQFAKIRTFFAGYEHFDFKKAEDLLFNP